MLGEECQQHGDGRDDFLPALCLQLGGFLSRRLWIPVYLTQGQDKLPLVLTQLTEATLCWEKQKASRCQNPQTRIAPGLDNAHDSCDLGSAVQDLLSRDVLPNTSPDTNPALPAHGKKQQRARGAGSELPFRTL